MLGSFSFVLSEIINSKVESISATKASPAPKAWKAKFSLRASRMCMVELMSRGQFAGNQSIKDFVGQCRIS